MEATKNPEPLPRPRRNSYRVEDIIAEYGALDNFLDAVCSKEPIQIPDFEFMDEENRRMDEILEEELQVGVAGWQHN